MTRSEALTEALLMIPLILGRGVVQTDIRLPTFEEILVSIFMVVHTTKSTEAVILFDGSVPSIRRCILEDGYLFLNVFDRHAKFAFVCVCVTRKHNGLGTLKWNV